MNIVFQQLFGLGKLLGTDGDQMFQFIVRFMQRSFCDFARGYVL